MEEDIQEHAAGSVRKPKKSSRRRGVSGRDPYILWWAD